MIAESVTNQEIEVSLRMLTNGRYVWTLIGRGKWDDRDRVIADLRLLDQRLRDAFPDHVSRGNFAVKEID